MPLFCCGGDETVTPLQSRYPQLKPELGRHPPEVFPEVELVEKTETIRSAVF
jgi:hypothetical protein